MSLIQSFSGIRGIYNDGFDVGVARKYALAYRELLLQRATSYKPQATSPKIIIARDTRHSGQEIFNAISDVFDNIIDLGIATTPMAELAIREYKADGGIIITASHNEPEWNGLKFLDKDGAVLRVKDIEWVIERFNDLFKNNAKAEIKPQNAKYSHPQKFLGETFVASYILAPRKSPKDFLGSGYKKTIKNKHSDIIRRYTDFIVGIIGKQGINAIKNSKIRFIIDPNGGSGILASDVLKKLGIEFNAINSEQGAFNRKIVPNEESLSYLKDIIKKQNIELGFGFDCDADRVEVVHSKGIVSGQYLLALAIDEVLVSSKNPKKEIVVVNDATSNIVRWVTNKYKAKLIETDVGEINVVSAMLRHGSIIGGEGSSSGVIIYPERCRDGILTMLMVLRIMAKRKLSIHKILANYPKYITLRKELYIEHKAEPRLKDYLYKYYTKHGYKVKKQGSIKVYIDENTFLWFRLSKTEYNKFRIIADSNSSQKANEIILEAYTRVNNYAKI